MLQCQSISVAIGSRYLLKDVSFYARAGEFTIIVGPNGAGKSTLLKVLSGEIRPLEGHVSYNGEPITRMRPAQLAKYRAVLPQSVTLAFSLTVEEVVRLGVEAAGVRSSAQASLCEAVLGEVGLGGWGTRLYQDLSGGEQQRVQFARVLAQVPMPVANGQPRFLLLDEPTSSLDIRHQIDLLERARRHAREGGGVVAIVHDLNLAAEFADRITVMSEGRTAASGSPGETLDDATISKVFGISGIVGTLPPPAMPFVLPQSRHAVLP